jgi:hypothetical protein
MNAPRSKGGKRPKAPLFFKLAVLGVSAGSTLAAAEALAAWSQGSAFPYLNIFEADARYGVVLESNASTRVRTRKGRVSSIRTNEHGFRGPRVSSPGGSILLLGDSQVLGFGVEENETVAGRLRAAGFEAHAVAVPSWGPIELALAAEDWVPRLRPKTVVFFANIANDWPEANVPNAERSTARDGWLARRRPDLTPETLTGFPGRRWLLARSHLVFSLRALRALRAKRPATELTLGAPAAERMLTQVGELSAPRGDDRSRLTGLVRRAVRACKARCRVVVAILPMDVQVDDREWTKYGRAARDLSSLASLSEGLLYDLRTLEVLALDLLPTLRAASPGAFLDDDPHLSSRGHEAIALQLRAVLSAPHYVSRPEVSP